jgi:gliotoxin/aspirochlorine biosynthesis O-methyltransferase
MFAHFQQQGWLALLYRTLGGGAIAMAPGVLEDYPWSDLAEETVLDLGGGGVALIVSLLRKYPRMRGSVYDLSSAVDHIKSFFNTPASQFADVGTESLQST